MACTGQGCNTTASLVCRFADAPGNSSAVHRRSLLRSNSDSSSTPDSPSADAEEVSWEGYKLIVKSKAANWGVDDTEMPEQARYIGAAPGHNRLIGGLFLHTTRKTIDAAAGCSGEGDRGLVQEHDVITAAA